MPVLPVLALDATSSATFFSWPMHALRIIMDCLATAMNSIRSHTVEVPSKQASKVAAQASAKRTPLGAMSSNLSSLGLVASKLKSSRVSMRNRCPI